MRSLRRRSMLAMPVALAAPHATSARSAAEEGFEAAERAILAGRTPVDGGISIDMPPLSENGNSVDISIRVDSPMTAEDHIATIHILSEKNPFPRVARFTLSPRAGRAEIATRIRLATTQTMLVLAETSGGRVHRGRREVIVILGACVEGG
jgi:sulfur-oxidizing protein SoxY